MTSIARTHTDIVDRGLHDAMESLELALPPADRVNDQDEEWVVVRLPSGWRKIRLHDYHEVFSVQGLYERWVYDLFKCRSPAQIRDMLATELRQTDEDPAELTVLDLGAGNGCVAEELASLGIHRFVGVDLHEEAMHAAERDRPDLYNDYVVCDITNLLEPDAELLEQSEISCLTCVAALGFGDIPPDAFRAALDHVRPDGIVAFTIKTDFVDQADRSGFSRLIDELVGDGELDIRQRTAYPHRITAAGDTLEYEAIIARRRVG